ncbi:MAG: ATPase domain-containing protein [Myxococcota bacterium]
MNKVPTHIPGLDELLMGGLPQGRATLLVGRSGVGKTLTALQIAVNAAGHGVSAGFHSFEERAPDLIQSAESLGWDAERLIAEKRLFIDFTRLPHGEEMQVSGNLDVASTARRLAEKAAQRGVQMLVLDSLSALFVGFDRSLRHHFYAFVEALIDRDLTVVLTAEAEQDRTRFGHEDFVCDLVLLMRQRMDERRRRRTVEVSKYRRSRHLQGEFPFVVSKEGVVVFPLDVVGQLPEAALPVKDRFSSGVEGLDDVTGGGWLRGRCVLLRGTSGSGKTIFSGCHIHAALRRGERVLLMGFEETEPMILANWDALGLRVRDDIKASRLRIVHRLPAATSPEDVIIELRRNLSDFQPDLVVLDSISAVEHASSDDGFRQFVVGVTSALRATAATSILVETTATEGPTGAPYMSTAADAIVRLGTRPYGGGHRRYLKVVKMRGSAHDMARRAIEIGGERHPMRVGPALART